MKEMQATVLLLSAMALPVFSGGGSLEAQSSEASTAEGVFTEDQADRGKEVFEWVCSECHLPAEFKGIIDDWAGSSVFDVYDGIRTTMPEDGPGSLRNQEYIDVVAYILDLNGVPAGSGELASEPDLMRDIRVAAPPQH